MFEYLSGVLNTTYGVIFPYLEVLFFIILFLVTSRISMLYIRKKLIKRATNKRQISDIKIFSRIINVVIFIVIGAIAFFAYVKSISGLGIFVGLITAGLGLALQKPITGIAAWIMVVIKRPFHIGDRIMIGNFKGEIYDITLTHIYIDETGGLAETEQHSGRHVMVPNYKLFENDIVNYTLLNDKILGEVEFVVKFKSNINKTVKMTEEIVNKLTKKYSDEINKTNSIKLNFQDKGIRVSALFYAPLSEITNIKNDLLMKLYTSLSKEKDIAFAHS